MPKNAYDTLLSGKRLPVWLTLEVVSKQDPFDV